MVCGLFCCILAVISLGSVPPLFYGIKYNSFTKAADIASVYEPGRYLIGPFNGFLLFPSDVQTIEFSDLPELAPLGMRYEPLHTRTKEGLGLHLQVAMQYKLIKESLGKLYVEFNMNYEPVFTSSVRDTLIKAASEYEATQLWEERKEFGDIMQNMVDKVLRKTYAECWGFQFMVMDLPDDFEDSIVRTQVQKQSMLIREQEQLSAQIRAETSVIQAEFKRLVRVIVAGGQANYTVITKGAHATAQQRKLNVESEVLASVKERLSLSAAELLRYQKYGALDDIPEARVLFGFSGSQQILLVQATAAP